MDRPRSSLGRRAGTVLLRLACLALSAELGVRATSLDFTLAAPLLFYQTVAPEAHEARSDPRLYALRPGYRGTVAGWRVTVDSRGFRGPERSLAKPPGTFRVLCYGGSNAFGTRVDDEQAWPARLESELARRLRRRVEVWNGGVCAYELRQSLEAARRGSSLYDPDLVLIEPGVFGRRTFLLGSDVRPAFAADPSLWLENLPWLPFGGSAADRALLRSRAARALVVAVNRLGAGRLARNQAYDSTQPSTDAYAAFARSMRVPFALVLAPSEGSFSQEAGGFYRLIRARSISLAEALPPGAGPEYRLNHPPARVYRWYARAIADQLEARGLLPTADGRAARAPAGRAPAAGRTGSPTGAS